MTLEPLLFTALAIYALAMIAISYFVGRDTDYEEFAIADRNVGFIPMVGSMASAFRDGSGIVFWVGTAATLGYAGLWFFAGAVLSFTLMGIIAPKVREYVEGKDTITIGPMLDDIIGSKAALLYSCLIIIYTVMLAVPQLWVIGNLMSGITGFSSVLCIVSATVITAIYLIAGGYASVTITDIIQFFLMGSMAFLPFIIDVPSDLLFNFDTLWDAGSSFKYGYIFLGMIIPLFLGDFWQRIMSAKTGRTARNAMFFMPLFYLGITLGFIFIGMGASANIDIADADNAIFAIYENRALPTWLLSVCGVVFISACMSTLDTQAYLFTSTLIKDVIKSKNKEKFIFNSRVVMAVLLLVAGTIAPFVKEMIDFTFHAITAASVTGPIVICAVFEWFDKRDRHKDMASMIIILISLIVFAYLSITGAYDNLVFYSVPAFASAAFVGIYLTIRKIQLRGEGG